MSSKELFLSPKAEAMFPFLTKPSTKFDKEGVYKITLLLDPRQAEHKGFLTALRGLLEETETQKKIKAKNKPWKKHLDLESKAETGLFEVTFKSQYPPRLFDSVGNKITGDLNVGNRSVVKIAFRYAPYEGFGGGIALYLQAVQILEFVEWAGGEASDYGFSSEEGEFNVESRFERGAGNEFDKPPASDEEAQRNPIPDDDIPF